MAGLGNQKIAYKYKMEATSQLFNNLHYGMLSKGIYSGVTLSKSIGSPTTEFTISPGVYLFETATSLVSTKISLSDPVTIDKTTYGFDATRSLVVARFTWVSSESNYMSMHCVDPAINNLSATNLHDEDIIVCKLALTPTELLDTTLGLNSLFNTEPRTIPYSKKIEETVVLDNFRIYATAPYTNSVNISEGKISSQDIEIMFPGDTSFPNNDKIVTSHSGIIENTSVSQVGFTLPIAGQHRTDLIVLNTSGGTISVEVIQGTPVAYVSTPVPPDYLNRNVIGEVTVRQDRAVITPEDIKSINVPVTSSDNIKYIDLKSTSLDTLTYVNKKVFKTTLHTPIQANTVYGLPSQLTLVDGQVISGVVDVLGSYDGIVFQVLDLQISANVTEPTRYTRQILEGGGFSNWRKTLRDVPNLSFDNAVTIKGTSGELLSVGPDTDISASIGRGKLGYDGRTDSFAITHYDNFNQTSYGLRLEDNATSINTKVGGFVNIRENNTNVATFSGSEISLLKLTNISASPTSSGSVRYELNINEENTAIAGRGGGIAFSIDDTIIAGVKGYNDGTGTTHSSLRWQTRLSNVLADKMVLSKYGHLLLGSVTDNVTDLLQVGSDTDVNASIGRGKLGYASAGSIDHFYIGHYDQFTASNFAIRVNSSGRLDLNSPTSQVVAIRNNNVDVATFSGSDISLLKSVNINEDNAGASLLRFQNTGVNLGFIGKGNYTVTGGSSTGLGISSVDILSLGAEGVKVADLSGSAISLLKPVTMTGNNTRITNNVGGGILLLGNENFTNSADRYRINFQDITTNSTRFDTKSVSYSHVFGSYNSGGDLLTHMTLNGSGRLMLNGTDNGVDLLQVGSNRDISASIGKLKISNVFIDHMVLSHYDMLPGSNYALLQRYDGETRLNSASGQSVKIRNNNNSDVAQFSGTDISLLKPTEITTADSNETLTINNNNTTASQNYGVRIAAGTDSSDFCLGLFDKGNTNTIALFRATEISMYQPLDAKDGIKTDNVVLKTKVLEIGDWDMNATSLKSVTHGIDVKKIRSLTCMIRDDADTNMYDLSTIASASSTMVAGGFGQNTATSIRLLRITGGFFDSTSYDSTSYNRGFVTIIYEA